MITLYPPGNRANLAAVRMDWTWEETAGWLCQVQPYPKKDDVPLWTALDQIPELARQGDGARKKSPRAFFLMCEWDDLSPEGLLGVLRLAAGHDAVVYTTSSSTPESPRVRLAMRTTRPILQEEQSSCVQQVSLLAGAAAARESEKMSQAWYAAHGDAHVWPFRGEPFDVDKAVATCPPRRGQIQAEPLPPELLETVSVEERAQTAWRIMVERRPDSLFQLACICVRDCAVEPADAKHLIKAWISQHAAWQDPPNADEILQRCNNAIFYGNGELGEALRPRRPFDDTGNALRLIDAHRTSLRFAGRRASDWWEFDGVLWRPRVHPSWLFVGVLDDLKSRAAQISQGDKGFHDTILAWVRKCRDKGKIEAAVSLAGRHNALQVDANDLDADPYLMGLGAAGTLDLRAAPLVRPGDPADLITHTAVEAAPAPASTAPRFASFLNDIFLGDQELIAYMQRFLGSCLVGIIREPVIQFWSGSGANGKSTLLKVMKGVLGDYAAPLPRRLFAADHKDGHPTEYATLRGKRLIFASESSKQQRLDEEKIKELTSGDPIQVRQMQEDLWEMKPVAKYVVAGNTRPTITGTDEGIWRRVHLVEFGASFQGAREVFELDKQLLAEETPGILGWLIDGYTSWREMRLSPPPAVTLATEEFRSASDVTERFLADMTISGPKYTITRSELWHLYRKWCADANEDMEGKHVFLGEMRKRFTETKKSHWLFGGLKGIG